MRRFLSLTPIGLSFFYLGALAACSERLTVLDADTEKPRDLAVSRPDLTGFDLAAPADMRGGMDLAAARDLAMDSDLGGPADMSMPADMSTPPDLAMTTDMKAGTDLAMSMDMKPPADLSLPDLRGPLDLAPADAGHLYSCRGTDAPGTIYKLVTDSIKLPKSSGIGTYAYDYDGDGKTENQLKTLVQALSVAGADLTSSINAAVASGAYLDLVSLTTSDLASSSCAGVVMVPAKPTPSAPKFDGSDVLQRFAGQESLLTGAIGVGMLSTKDSKDLLPAEDSPLNLHLSVAGTGYLLPLHGVHIQGTVDKSSTPLRLKDVSLHSVIAATDINLIFLPAIATLITKAINADPTSSTTATLIGLFENMSNPTSAAKCMTPSLCCHTSPSTCVILPQEVKESPVGGVLSPDVQVFDTSGAWKPTPGGTLKNAMSFGLGFTAVAASFP